MRERHLDGTALLASPGASSSGQGGTSASQSQSTGGILDAVRRSDLLICDVERGGMAKNARRKDKDKALIGKYYQRNPKFEVTNHSMSFEIDIERLLTCSICLFLQISFTRPSLRTIRFYFQWILLLVFWNYWFFWINIGLMLIQIISLFLFV